MCRTRCHCCSNTYYLGVIKMKNYREIKFRAWDKKKKIMYLPGVEAVILSFGKDIEERFKMMQYTGLKDKNGKEIYEGDIVTDRGNTEYKYEVYWIDDEACFALKGFPEYEYSFNEEVTEGEVIGNIYENKELLK